MMSNNHGNNPRYLLKPRINAGVPEVTCEDLMMLFANVADQKIKIIDVRGPDEFNDELGHIQGAQMITLGQDLINYLEKERNKDQEIVFVCRSGGRSAAATVESMARGFRHAANMTGGMLRWNKIGLTVEKK